MQERILPLDRWSSTDVADIVQEQVHQGHPGRGGHNLPAVEGFFFQEARLFFVEGVGRGEEVVGRQEEAARATGGVGDGLFGLGPHTFHDGFDQVAGGEILACAAFGVLGIFFQQPLVHVAFDVGVHTYPRLLADQLHQAGSVLRTASYRWPLTGSLSGQGGVVMGVVLDEGASSW